jgi:hypothetical protein
MLALSVELTQFEADLRCHFGHNRVSNLYTPFCCIFLFHYFIALILHYIKERGEIHENSNTRKAVFDAFAGPHLGERPKLR